MEQQTAPQPASEFLGYDEEGFAVYHLNFDL